MNRRFDPPSLLPALGVFFIAVVAGFAQSESPEPHPGFVGRLASPEIVVGLREQLGLSEKQVRQIHLVHEHIGAKAEAANREVKKRTDALNGYLENAEIDAGEAEGFLDRLSKAEAAAKRIHIGIMIEVDGLLTKEQREKLAQLRASGEIQEMIERGNALQKRIQTKVKKFQEQLQVYADLGGPPYRIAELAEKIGAAMKEKDLKEADKLLDKALAESDEK